MTHITDLRVFDLRFPTSQRSDGSDAMNPDPDYSAAYVLLAADRKGLAGHGLTFTFGRGNGICCLANQAMQRLIAGLDLGWIKQDPGRFWRHLTNDSQLRRIGPDKGALHLATGALVNAVWDLWAKEARKPVWRLIAEMTPEQIVKIVDFRYLTDVLTPDEALILLRQAEAGKAERIAILEREGYPCYTTSAGWLGYPGEKLRRLCKEAIDLGFDRIKMKAGREAIGLDRHLAIDACRMGGLNEALSALPMAAKYGLPVWPHAGGVGLCEYVQHLSMIDYIAISGTKTGRGIEFADPLHEPFIDPCVIKDAAYMPPVQPGFSIEIKAETLSAIVSGGRSGSFKL